ncbi:type II toxin-antitoxin system VapB family antitoxin, partial [Candidatus Entotheonella palauensis]|uniref:type II toxin-antitoxin system VapB family antitoxin n=1 Tax=Candidatus Entotheonella palauensis TaxID=93172 RepID=UPI0015C4C1CD
MKTTVEIADALLEEVKKVAAQEHTTVRALVEEGLRQVIENRQQRTAFHLRRASFGGRGREHSLILTLPVVVVDSV